MHQFVKKPGRIIFRWAYPYLIRYKILRSVLEEFVAIAGGCPKGKDPFEWVQNRRFRRLYWDVLLKHRLPLAVEFEMNSLCNRRCSYCPNVHQARPKGFLDLSLYKKLIDELALYKYRGYIIPNFYGEPLLDERIDQFVQYARKVLPSSIILINTNADFLSVDRFYQLVEAGVDIFLISQHDPTPSAAIQELSRLIDKHPNLGEKINIVNWTSASRVLSSRGGLIDDDRIAYMSKTGCFRSRRATLTFDGDLIICCEDFLAEYIYGNINDQDFIQLWKLSLSHRREIFLGNYTEPICRTCAGLSPLLSERETSIRRSGEQVRVVGC
ncbi:MAG: SPASM domain-containing protein [Candidatus Tectomicrobia bacterium]|nr:SPASM domain-containing protein [Candidatus Tectomicrobia bacterium]